VKLRHAIWNTIWIAGERSCNNRSAEACTCISNSDRGHSVRMLSYWKLTSRKSHFNGKEMYYVPFNSFLAIKARCTFNPQIQRGEGLLSPAQKNILVWLSRHCLEVWPNWQLEWTEDDRPQMLKLGSGLIPPEETPKSWKRLSQKVKKGVEVRMTMRHQQGLTIVGILVPLSHIRSLLDCYRSICWVVYDSSHFMYVIWVCLLSPVGQVS